MQECKCHYYVVLLTYPPGNGALLNQSLSKITQPLSKIY